MILKHCFIFFEVMWRSMSKRINELNNEIIRFISNKEPQLSGNVINYFIIIIIIMSWFPTGTINPITEKNIIWCKSRCLQSCKSWPFGRYYFSFVNLITDTSITIKIFWKMNENYVFYPLHISMNKPQSFE